MNNRKPNILVTGAAGLFGANFSRYLLKSGYSVIGIDNLSGGCKDHLPHNKNFTFIKSSLKKSKNLVKIIKKHNIEYVFHFAAFAAAGYSPFVREYNYKNNIMSSAALINACIKTNVKKIVYTSSMEIYGNMKPPFVEEKSICAVPETPYGIAKRAIELDLKSAKEFHDLDYSIIRPHNVHGKYQNIWDRYRNVIGIFIVKAINGEELTVYGDGEQQRAFSNIKYYMKPLEKLMYYGCGETYNIGADNPTTILKLAETVINEARKFDNNNISIRHLEPRKEVKFAFCNHDKAKGELDFVDNTDLGCLVHEMYSWAVKQPSRTIKKQKPEIIKNLYGYWK